MKIWYQADIKSNQAHPETGVMRAVLTHVLLEAVSYSDAETIINRVIEEGEIESNGEFSISKISKSSVTDVPFHFQGIIGVSAQQEALLQEADEDEFDDETNWRVATEHDTILVNAVSAVEAASKVERLFVGTAVEANITAIQKTKISNIFRHEDGIEA